MQAPSRCCCVVDWDRPVANDRPAIGSGDDHRIVSTSILLSSVLARAGRGDRNRQLVSLLGHTAAAWPVSVIGSRRLIGSPQGSGKGIAHPQFSTRQLAGRGLADVAVGSRLLDNAGSLTEAQNGCHPNCTSVTSFSWSDALRCTFALRRGTALSEMLSSSEPRSLDPLIRGVRNT
jgi:hypothetical protein